MTGYMLTYDFATWSVGIVAMESTPSCECRMSRNADSVSITMDDNDLCTRVYAVGLSGGYTDADTVSTWGVISKSLGTADNAIAAEVQAYAAQYLAEYKNPRVNVEVSALELAAQTGESIDAFEIGKLCRVALPDWGYSTEQRIIAISYSDLLGSPNDAKLSLSTAPRDLSRTLAGMSTDLYGTSTVNNKSARGGGGGGASPAGAGDSATQAGSILNAGNGQTGYVSTLSGSSVYYGAGGGGGVRDATGTPNPVPGTGGTGGGGNGSGLVGGGPAGDGSGYGAGGGGGTTSNWGTGYQGIVIIKIS